LLLVVILTPVACYLGGSGMERAVLIGVLLLVLIVEVLNSALEAVVDRFGDDRHELSKAAKDLGSAAVFIALVNVVVVWVLVLFT
jgi:diacylglycerol kinase (ATP)